jgi:hypothetical protein
MEEDIYTDSIDDIISVLNLKKQTEKKSESTISKLLDQYAKNECLEVHDLLK